MLKAECIEYVDDGGTSHAVFVGAVARLSPCLVPETHAGGDLADRLSTLAAAHRTIQPEVCACGAELPAGMEHHLAGVFRQALEERR